LHSIAREEERASSEEIVYAMEAGTQRYRYQIAASGDQEAKSRSLTRKLREFGMTSVVRHEGD